MSDRDIMNIENKFLNKEEAVEKNRILAERKARMRSAAEDYDNEREAGLKEKAEKKAEAKKAKKEKK